MGAAGVEPDTHQRQLLCAAQRHIFQRGLPDALSHPLDHIAFVFGGIPEQQVGEGGGILRRTTPQHGQILLGDAALRHGGGELACHLPAAGEQHDAAHDLVQPVDGGDVVGLSLCPVVLPQQGGHADALLAVLREDANRLDAEDEIGVLVQDM